MSFYHWIIVIFFAILFAGCSSSDKGAARDAPQGEPEVAVQDSAQPTEPSQAPSLPPSQQAGRAWTPRFIPTGSASGIMIEFTGLKKNAELHARYAGIELQHIARDSSTQVLPSTLTFTTTINDLRQAFFKVSPGKYLLRQTKAWADQSTIRDV